MELSTTTIDSVTIITVTGEVNAATAPALGNLIQEQLSQGQSRLVVDLSQAGYISSAGLRVLLVGVKACRRAGGDLHLAELPQPVQEVFDMAGFSPLFEIFDDRDAAVASFAT